MIYHLYLLFLFLPLLTFSQEKSERKSLPTKTTNFEYNFFREDSQKTRVDISYRIRYDAFVFVRDGKTYSTDIEFSFEILDSLKNSVTRKIFQTTLQTETNTIFDLQKQYYQTSCSFILPFGKYNVIPSIENKQSERKIPLQEFSIIVPSFNNTLENSSLLFVEPIEKNPTSFELLNKNGKAVFGKSTGILFITKNISSQLRYEIKKEQKIILQDSLEKISIISNTTLGLSENDSTNISYKAKSDNQNTLIYFSLPTEQLEEGDYELLLYSQEKIIKKNFSVYWFDKPVSLFNVDFAISAMKYITSDSTFSALQKGNEKIRKKSFEDFWKQQDPTPKTAYNERMAEYFRRVDYAYVTFQTLQEENGAYTDRGKIYILYGKPTSTQRILSTENVPQEIWDYQTLKKQFIFEDKTRQGNYKLISSER